MNTKIPLMKLIKIGLKRYDFVQRVLRVKKKIVLSYHYFSRKKRIKERLERILTIPRNLYFEVTNICNASCVFCPYSIMKRKKGFLDERIFAKTLEDYVRMGGTAISLTPIVGEPLIDPDFFNRIDRITEFPEIKNVGFVTNGVLLTPEKIERILSYSSPFISILISLGGFDKKTFIRIMGIDKYERTIENIIYLINKVENPKPKNIKISIGLRMPLDNRKGPFYEFLCNCERRGVINIDYFNERFDNFGGKIKSSKLKSIGLTSVTTPFKKGPCQTLFTKPIVIVNGKVSACAQRDLEGELEIGNIKEQTIQEVLSGEKRMNLIKAHQRGDFPELCRKCSLYTSIYQPSSLIWKSSLNWRCLK